MQSYLVHMRFPEIVQELMLVTDERARQLLIICAYVVGPTLTDYPTTLEGISPELIDFAREFVSGPQFSSNF